MLARLTTIAIAMSTLAFCSCGNSSGLYPVNGKVLFNQEPAVGATVSFLKKDAIGSTAHTPVSAVVSEDGSFSLSGPDGEGALAGEYIVLVEWKEGAGKVKGRSPALNAPDRLNKKYLDPNKPLLTATVEAKNNQLPPFELN